MNIFNLLSKEEEYVLNILIDFFISNDIKAYIVGGAVRDAMLRVKPKDIDICVNKSPREFISRIPEVNEVKYYEKFDTSSVIFHNGVQIDIIRCRKEIYKENGALPCVCPSNIEDDLARRDFTINAIAYDMINGEIIDLYGGIEDIHKKVIKKINMNSYNEDATRIFRAVKYSVRYGFQISDEKEIVSCVRGKVFDTISYDRIIKEILLMCKEDNWIHIFFKFKDLGIVDVDGNLLGMKNLLYDYEDVYVRLVNVYLSFKNSYIKDSFIYNSMLHKDLRIAFKDYKTVEGELLVSNSNYQIYNCLVNLNKFYFIVLSWNKKSVYKIENFYKMNYNCSISGQDVVSLGIQRGKIIGSIIEYIKELELNINLPLGKTYLINNIGEILDGVKYKNR